MNTDTNWVRVGIGELAVSDRPRDLIITAALGSCVAVCVWEPVAAVAGMLHFLLPDARSNPERAKTEPAAFADSGIPLLFHAAYKLGAQKNRCQVWLIGGADVAGHGSEGALNMGQRNVLAARGVLWQNGVMIQGESVGGTAPRTVTVAVSDGRIMVKANGKAVAELFEEDPWQRIPATW